jgi:hypothetical protein
MRTYIENHANEINPDPKSKIKHCVYMNRMQKRIDRELQNMLWFAIHYPNIFLDEDKPHKDAKGKVQANRRLKNLILTIKALKPKMDVVLVLNNMDIPEELKTIN